MAELPTVLAFASWPGAGRRRACPLAAFAFARDRPLALSARLVCVDPPRADGPTIANAADVRGAIALVVRGGCSFADKARRVQQAGAVAMVLANNTREEPAAAFTMAEDDADDADAARAQPPITIPCVMMCLLDVRELFQKFPPTVTTGVLTLEVLEPSEAAKAAEESMRLRKEMLLKYEQLQRKGGGDGGWSVGSVFKRKTSALMKMLDPQPGEQQTAQRANDPTRHAFPPELSSDVTTTQNQESGVLKPLENELQPVVDSCGEGFVEVDEAEGDSLSSPTPLVAFVQWANRADAFNLQFSPLADFCKVQPGAVFDGPLIVCDPVLADTDILNGSALQGSIALVKRGACTFPAKLERVQACGAIAAIVGNDDSDNPDAAFVMSVDSIKTDHITIPAVMVSSSIFQRLTYELPARIRMLCVSAGPTAADLLTRSGIETQIKELFVNSNIDQMSMSCLLDTQQCKGESSSKFTFDEEHSDRGVAFLHAACRNGDYDECLHAIDNLCGENERLKTKLVQECDRMWRTSLHHACIGGNDRIVELLLQLGASPLAIDLAGQSPLHIASAYAQTRCLELLIQIASSSNLTEDDTTYGETEDTDSFSLMKPDIGGSTPIHLSTMAGSTECLELLLTANAQVAESGSYDFRGVDDKDADGATPLHLACRYAHADCAAYLLAANAKIDPIDRNNCTPLRVVCQLIKEGDDYESEYFDIIEKLINAGARMEEIPVQAFDPKDISSGVVHGLLLLDLIDSPIIKREVEVLYLRYEAKKLKKLADELEAENANLRLRVSTLEDRMDKLGQENKSTTTAKRVELLAQQRQIDQLQYQMLGLLQLLHGKEGGTSTHGNITDGQLDTAVGERLLQVSNHSEALMDDHNYESQLHTTKREDCSQGVSTATVGHQDLALDAGLARDLGKKFLRKKQYDLAETYFEQSMQLFPLPGVAQLCEKARSAQVELSKRRFVDKSTNILPSSQESPAVNNSIVLNLLATVSALEAPTHIQDALQREVAKLNSTPAGSIEFELTYKWLQWLTSLPWRDQSIASLGDWKQSEPLKDVFLQLENLEKKQELQVQTQAARVIQRFIRRQRGGGILHCDLTGSSAAIRIQRFFRLWHSGTKGSAESIYRSVTEDDDAKVRNARLEQPSEQSCAPNSREYVGGEIDFNVVVDPAVRPKLSTHRTLSLLSGVRLDGSQLNGTETFRVIQLLRAQKTKYPSTHNSETYYVWTRWRCNHDSARSQGALSGPYDALEAAHRRFSHLLNDKQEHAWQKLAQVHNFCPSEVEKTPPASLGSDQCISAVSA